MPYGLLATGFVPATVEAIREEIATEIGERFGPTLGDAARSDTTAIGFLVGILAERYGLLWELEEAIWSSQDPDKATGAALDAIAALTGTVRDFARRSTVTLTLVGEASTVVPAGSQARAAVTQVFETVEPATIAAVPAWASTTFYDVGDRVHAPGLPSPRVYECVEAGTSSGAAPVGETAAVTDGSVVWSFLGGSSAITHGAVDVAARATVDGAILGAARDITTIVTAVSGWFSVINLEAAVVGRLDETDGELRARRESELVSTGTPTVDGIRKKVLAVNGVTTCTVFNNPTDATNPDGMPPHSVEALVQGGADQDIWDALLASVAAGIATHGTETGSAPDSQGTPHTVKFSRPNEIEIYVHVNYIYDPATTPADHADQIKAAVVDFGNGLGVGYDAVASALGAQAFRVRGVLDVPAGGGLGGCLIDLSAGPTSDVTIAIGSRELAVYAVSRVTVSGSSGVP
jgi:uncharacterized phage protein gp47/JayE